MRPSGDLCGCFPTGRHYPGIAHLTRLQAAGAVAEFEGTCEWVDLPIVMIDVETTGKDPATDRIVELAVVRGERGVVVSRDAWLMNPGVPIPPETTAVHGISDDDVRDKASFAELSGEIARALQGAIPSAYNAPFDRGFVHAEMARAGRDDAGQTPALRPSVQWIDPLIWARHIQASERSRSLGDVAPRLGVVLDQAHRATADAEAALMVMYKLGQDPRVPRAYGGLLQEQARLASAQQEARKMWRR